LNQKTVVAAHAALIVVALIYGLNYIIAKDVMPHYLQPRAFILLRVSGAALLFSLLLAFTTREKIAKSDWPRFIAAGFLGVAANQILFFEGLNITSPISASVIMTTNPIMVLLLSLFFLKVPIRPLRVVGIILGLGGAILLISKGQSLANIFKKGESLGNLLVMLNAFCYAGYLVVVKPLMSRYKALTVIRTVFWAGFVFVLPLGFSQLQSVQWLEIPSLIYGSITYVVLATTFLAYLLNIFALKTVSSTTVSFYIYLQPLFATAAALLLGKDQLSLITIMAAALIFSGVYLVSFQRK
jgi:drug/metabolite transporter (DMT)-like permease